MGALEAWSIAAELRFQTADEVTVTKGDSGLSEHLPKCAPHHNSAIQEPTRNVATLKPCLLSGICFGVVGRHGCTVPLRPDPSKANGTKCFLRLLEVDNMGKTKSRFLWLGMKRDNWKISAQLMHLCFLLRLLIGHFFVFIKFAVY